MNKPKGYKMRNRDLKKFLTTALENEEMLIDTIEECLEIIFKPLDLVNEAKSAFNEDLECSEENGCLQSIEYMMQNLIKHREERRAGKEKALLEIEKQNEKNK